MLNLTTRLCWELVKKEGYIVIWKKPLNNTCYLSRDASIKPSLCEPYDDPDNVWCALEFFISKESTDVMLILMNAFWVVIDWIMTLCRKLFI